MKILLLEHPRTVCPERCNDIANTPLSSCLHSGSIAGLLISEGHEVEIIEGFLDGLDYQEIERRVKAMNRTCWEFIWSTTGRQTRSYMIFSTRLKLSGFLLISRLMGIIRPLIS